MKLNFYIFFLVFISAFAAAQEKSVVTSIDTTRNKIGAQFTLTLKADVDTASIVKFPGGKAFGKLEVIRNFATDTIKKDNRLQLIKSYGLTQFDSGKYTIPRLPMFINNQQVFTDSILIEVTNVKVDTVKQKMYDIKDIIKTGSSNSDWWKYLLIVLAIAGIGFLLYRYIRKNQSRSSDLEKFKSPIEKAATLLQQLEKKELWQKGEIKNYYSELTDIARNYIEEAIHVPAMESTTSELIAGLRNAAVKNNMKLTQETVANLENVLMHADLVKFAKSRPLDYEIAEDRKKIERSIFTLDEAIPEITEDEVLFNEAQKQKLLKRQKRNRILLTASVVVFLLAATATYFVATKGYDYVRDNIIGHPTKSMLEGEWVFSEYGAPPIALETPRVLTRQADGGNMTPKIVLDSVSSGQVFSFGSFEDNFMIVVQNMTYQGDTTIDLANITESLSASLATQGAMNIIIKQEEYEHKGISGVKAFGTFKIKDGNDNKKLFYQNLIFAERNGLQQITIINEDGDKYAEQIASRILNSVELKPSVE